MNASDSSAPTEETTALRSRPLTATIVLAGGLVALVFAIAVSVSVGAKDIRLSTVWDALFRFDPELTSHQIVRSLRMPRALTSALVGAALAVAGAIMQGMTRNPLADPGLLGINAGSGLAIAVVFAFFPGLHFPQLMLVSFLGAALGAAMVFGVGSLSRGGMSPVRLALAGAAVMGLLNALSEGIAFRFRIGQELTFWLVGGTGGTSVLQVGYAAPWILIGLLAALLLSGRITLLSLGDETASGLGVRLGPTKLLCLLVVLALAGASVATVGAIGFVGLVVPHIARHYVGVTYKWIIPCSAVIGALLLVLADIGGRMIHPPQETPVGAIIALIGVPFFLYLVRRTRKEAA